MYIKQQQIKAELNYQQQQNQWLQQINTLNTQLAQIDPNQSRAKYSSVERSIFYASENANFAYVESLIARYKDQVQQMKLSIMNSTSISLLNEIGDQLSTINKQISKLDSMMQTRMAILEKHVSYLTKRKSDPEILDYTNKLTALNTQYKAADESLLAINKSLTDVRASLDKALQKELSARQGFPSLGFKSLVDLGKELLYLPALTFKIVKSLTTTLCKGVMATSGLGWYIFGVMEILYLATCMYLRKSLLQWITYSNEWREQLRLSLHWFSRCFVDLAIIANVLGVFYYFGVPQTNFSFLIYLSLVWMIFKSIMVIARLSLVESAHDNSGHDVRLYFRLKWIFLLGGIITAFTVFVHQIPMIYELKALCDRLFLLLLMVVSILLLRSSDVVPNLILMHTESRHPYMQKSIRLLGILVPILMFANAVIGLFGFVNLILTVSWYEGIFLLVLIGYLILRGLLTDAMEYSSRLMIQYFNNGWLWTEAFLKPLDNVLRITLFLVGWAVLFLLYGWDKQSPVVDRLVRLLQYQLINVLNTSITPLNIIELCVVISIFYWTAKWTREFVFRLLLSRTKDMGIRNSIAILSQYSVVVIGVFICLRVMGINLQALTVVGSMFALGIGLGLSE
jgi:potassium-dependent mechanosensitive channel